MPATLLDSRQTSWCMFSKKFVSFFVFYFLRYFLSDPQPDIPAKPTRFGWMELQAGPLKSRLASIGWVVRGFASAVMMLIVFSRGLPRFIENKAHSTVWTVYSAFVTLAPVPLLVQMQFVHGLRSGAVVWFAVVFTPASVLRWLIGKGAGVNGHASLAIAASANNASKVAVLLAAGADVHARWVLRQTPILCHFKFRRGIRNKWTGSVYDTNVTVVCTSHQPCIHCMTSKRVAEYPPPSCAAKRNTPERGVDPTANDRNDHHFQCHKWGQAQITLSI
jgi:hypothetical protein